MDAKRKRELETAYGVHIAEDAFHFSGQILQACKTDLNLQVHVDDLQLVERACRTLRESLDSDSEEKNLAWDEYCMDRAFVEVMELKKEKCMACQSVFLPRVKREYKELISKWECLVMQIAHMRENSHKRVDLLKVFRGEMVSFMKRITSGTKLDLEQLLQGISTANTQLQRMVPSAFQEKRLVSPSVVAQVASSITRFPVKYFQPPFNMRPTVPEDLKMRLMKKVINLNREIHQITHALSKQKSSRGPFGSFLMLGLHGCGRTTLAKALAEEIFDDKDRFLKLDMSQYMEPDSLSRLVANLKSDKKHGTVVMFDNVENAPWSNEAFFSILRNGRLIDETDVGVDFSHDILLVSSHIGSEDFVDCSCLRDIMQNRSSLEILKEPSVSHKTCCYLLSFYNKVRDYFKLELMKLFDDMVLFRQLTPLDHMTICRLQIRDVAASMGSWLKKKVILYPSHAAVQSIMSATNISERGAHGYESWAEVYMYPMLDGDTLKNEESDDIFIYIDVFMGLRKQYSLRTETSKHLGKNLDFKRSKQSLWKLRSRYRRVKQEVDNIYSLQASCFRLSELICNKAEIDVDSVVIESKKVVSLIDDILLNDIIEPELIHVDDFVGRLKRLPRSRRAQTQRLQSLSEVGDKATQVILGNGSNKSGHLPTSFLCLGLAPPSIKKLVESLAQNLGKKLLIEIDLSQCTGPEQFLRNVEKTQSVIVCYELETANISVFSTLLSILEDGISVDQSGNITDFQNSVFVVVSNLGSKKVIGWLTGNYYQTQTTSPVQQEVRGGLRSELLNRLDHLLLFDPFSDDQLNAFTMLALKSMKDECCIGLYIVFQYLFGAEINNRLNRSPAVDTQLLLEAAAGKDGIVSLQHQLEKKYVSNLQVVDIQKIIRESITCREGERD